MKQIKYRLCLKYNFELRFVQDTFKDDESMWSVIKKYNKVKDSFSNNDTFSDKSLWRDANFIWKFKDWHSSR